MHILCGRKYSRMDIFNSIRYGTKTVELTIPILPVISSTTNIIAEEPLPQDPISLSLPSVPTLSTSTILFVLADTTGVCTISQAAPTIVTCNGHNLIDGQEIFFQTAGTLPAPLVVGTHYFVVYIGINTFNISLTAFGPPFGTTTPGSGVHKVLGKV